MEALIKTDAAIKGVMVRAENTTTDRLRLQRRNAVDRIAALGNIAAPISACLGWQHVVHDLTNNAPLANIMEPCRAQRTEPGDAAIPTSTSKLPTPALA